MTAVSGFSKPGSNYNIDNILKGNIQGKSVSFKTITSPYLISGQIGDDAYFIARHVDEWSQSDFDVSSSLLGSQEREPELSPSSSSSSQSSNPADDASVRNVASVKGNADVIGVADGVGGWRDYGVDPGLFSNHLMRNCERLVKAGFFISNSPRALLKQV